MATGRSVVMDSAWATMFRGSILKVFVCNVINVDNRVADFHCFLSLETPDTFWSTLSFVLFFSPLIDHTKGPSNMELYQSMVALSLNLSLVPSVNVRANGLSN